MPARARGRHAADDAARRERHPWRRWYSLKVWRDLRAWQLARHPLCWMCEADGRVTAASVADHRTAHKGDWRLFIDPANLGSLCRQHHDSTKQREEATGRVAGTDPAGTPLDPGHHWNA